MRAVNVQNREVCRSKKKKKRVFTRKIERFSASFRLFPHFSKISERARVVLTSICERENHHGAGEEEERDDEEQEETTPRVGNRLLALFKVRQNERR